MKTETMEGPFEYFKKMDGAFEMKKVINNRGYYVKMYLEVQKIPYHEVEVDLGSFTRWKGALTFAADYVLEHYGEHTGLRIKIIDIYYMDGDSSNMDIFFGFVQAVHNALNTQCKLIIDDSGKFVIPK